jgi:predicted enzyme involved in methoxymalonyl-ACP biosynthesis
VEEVKALRAVAPVLVLRARDRFGDYGLVGACILRATAQPAAWELDTLLMSCRAMGRGVEDAFLHSITRLAAQRGAATLLAPYVDGPRNDLIKDFLSRSGFAETAPNAWTRSIVELPPLPAHVELHLVTDPPEGPAQNGYAADKALETALLAAR